MNEDEVSSGLVGEFELHTNSVESKELEEEANHIHAWTKSSDSTETEEPVDNAGLINSSGSGNSARPLDNSGSINSAGPVDNSRSINSAGPVDISRSINSAGPVDNSRSINSAGPVEISEPVNSSGPVDNAGPVDNSVSINSAKPINIYGPVNSSGPFDSSGSINSAGPVDNFGSVLNSKGASLPQEEIFTEKVNSNIVGTSSGGAPTVGDAPDVEDVPTTPDEGIDSSVETAPTVEGAEDGNLSIEEKNARTGKELDETKKTDQVNTSTVQDKKSKGHGIKGHGREGRTPEPGEITDLIYSHVGE